jgi:hypothetical protein
VQGRLSLQDLSNRTICFVLGESKSRCYFTSSYSSVSAQA